MQKNKETLQKYLTIREYGLEKTDEKDITENRTAGNGRNAAVGLAGDGSEGGRLYGKLDS